MENFSSFAQAIYAQKYSLNGKETWPETAHRVATSVMSAAPVSAATVKEIEGLIATRKFMPGGRYLYAAGRPYKQTQNCALFRAHDSREGWAELLYLATMALMSGAGIGVDYSNIRPEGSLVRKTGGFATGPCSLMEIINEAGRRIMQGGSRRSAIWAGLNWAHPDCKKFIAIKNWSREIREAKNKDYNFAAPLDGTNISVLLDTKFFAAYSSPVHPLHKLAHEIYWLVIRQMMETSEPGFSVDFGKNEGETLRNACTEICSADSGDICNLGSINMARIGSLSEMQKVVELATTFLLAGTLYSDLPCHKIDEIRTKNRRLGLGLMGLHEWLLLRGKSYGADDELEKYLVTYATSTDIAHRLSDRWGISRSIKTRAIAPTGTIGIVAETTGGCEPVFCVALKRRYLKGKDLHYQYIVDPTAQRLIKTGVAPEQIEDAYTLAENVERRVKFQAWLQRYVDHGISSTINMPRWGSRVNCETQVKPFGDMLFSYLPSLRGVTCFADGSRGAQPLTPVPYAEAIKREGQVFIEQQDVCELSNRGSCG